MKDRKFSIKKRIESFKYAFNGFRILLRNEHNMRIHIFFSIISVGGGFFFNISTTEWIGIFLAIALVIAMESMNTAIEYLSDYICPEKNNTIKKVKDLAAFAVFICAAFAFIIGLIIFIPRIYEFLRL